MLARVAVCQALDSRLDSGAAEQIFQAIHPVLELACCFDLH
jgi:hypothetical protein